jgi:hypothetical protein
LGKRRLSRKDNNVIRHRVISPESIPQELKDHYGYLSGALIGTYQSWNALERLYMDNGVVALLNGTGAPEFFVLLQELLADNIILSIAKLTDKAKTGPQENWTLSRLVDEVPEQYSELRTRLGEKWKIIENTSRPIMLYRHKLLAHADRVECLNPNTELGKDISIKFIREVLEQIADFLNTFDYEFTKSGGTDYPSTPTDVTEDFIAYLRQNI